MNDASQACPNAEKPQTRRKILLVDDNEGNLMAMTLLLKRGNIDAHTAEDGETAIDMLNRDTFDLMLTDVDMPNMTGFELLEWVRVNKPDMPVLLMSGSASGATGHTSRQALAKGARGVLSKPFVVSELERAIAEILN